MDSDQTIREQSTAAGMGAFFWDLFKVFIISGLIIVPVRYYVAQPFIVSGSSMEPNFHHGEYLVIDELTYNRGKVPQRGEVIVFKSPTDPGQFYIKRIIGLPGETVQIADGTIKISNHKYPTGVILKESYLPKNIITLSHKPEIKLGNKEYFVLGDNRNNSSDSRYWGPLPKENITGKAFIRAYPFQNFTKFSEVKYNL